MDQVAERLAELRERRALTLRELGEMSGVAADTINQIELGHRKARPSTLRKLARALEIDVREFYGEPTRPKAGAPSSSGQPEVRGRGTGWLEDLVAGLVRQEAEAPASQEAEIKATLENLLNELHQLVEVVSDQDERYEVAGRVEKAYTNLIDGLERSLRPVAEAEKRRGRRRSESSQSRR